MEINGLDTINKLAFEPPKENCISYDIMKTTNLLKAAWNGSYIAVLPVCFLCKEPLVWHTPADADSTLFHCPKCKRRWVKDENWIEQDLRKGRQ
jgi:hypothetical protein